MTVLCVNSSIVYADIAAADAAEGGTDYGVPTEFVQTGSSTSAVSFTNTDYPSGLIYRATSGEETTGDINIGASLTATLTSTVNGMQLSDLRTANLSLTSCPNVVLRRLVIDAGGGSVDGVLFNNTIDAQDILIHNCNDGFLSSVVRLNSLIDKCTVVGATRFGYAQGKFNNCVDINSANQGYFNEAVGSSSTWEHDGTGTDTITESPATDIFENFATGDYRIKPTSSPGVAGAGAFINSGGGGVSISPVGISSVESFGNPSVVNLNQILGVPSTASLESVGTPILINSQILQPSSIASVEALGAPVVISGGVVLEITSISPEESLGAPSLLYAQIVSVVGIGSEESFGIAVVQDGVALVIPIEDRVTYQKIQRFLQSTGKFVSTQNNDIIVEWLKSEGHTSTQFNNLFSEYWESLGYTGAYNDKWKKWRDS